MMGSCAFLMPVGSVRFIEKRSYALRPALGLALGGVPAVLVAVYIVKAAGPVLRPVGRGRRRHLHRPGHAALGPQGSADASGQGNRVGRPGRPTRGSLPTALRPLADPLSTNYRLFHTPVTVSRPFCKEVVFGSFTSWVPGPDRGGSRRPRGRADRHLVRPPHAGSPGRTSPDAGGLRRRRRPYDGGLPPEPGPWVRLRLPQGEPGPVPDRRDRGGRQLVLRHADEERVRAASPRALARSAPGREAPA